MPLIPIKLRPGINSVQSPTLNEAGWSAGSNIRFFQGLMQKDSGWVTLFTTPIGPVGDLHAWTALSLVNYLGVGVNTALFIWDGTLTDISPSGLPLPANGIITLDNWGEFLMACYSGGPIYVWQPESGLVPAIPIGGQSPPSVGFIFISTQAQQLIACGMVNASSGLYDPMLVGWSDVGNYTVWTAAPSNEAGTFRLAIGSEIRAALPLYGQNLIWTDIALYSMQYIQPPLVYGFQPLGLNCGADGPHAVGVLGGRVFWKSQNQFMTLGPTGAPVQIECPVWDQVFPQQDRSQAIPVVCQTDSYYGEVSWVVLQKSGAYVRARLHAESGAWTIDTSYYPEIAWTDQSVFGAPIAGWYDGRVVQHDLIYDADGGEEPLSWSATTGIAMIAEGDEATFVQDLIPDFMTNGTNPAISIMVYAYDYPNAPPRAHGPFVVSNSTQVIHPRCRGRGLQLSLSGDDIGAFVRLGNVRYRGNPDGKR